MYLLRETDALLPESAAKVLEVGPSKPLHNKLSNELGSRYVSFDREELNNKGGGYGGIPCLP